MAPTKLMHMLTYLGAIPFVICAIAIAFDISPIPIDGHHSFPSWEMILLTYSAIILSFMGGIHWGVAMHTPEKDGTLKRALWSNVLSLTGWLVLLIPSTFIALSILCAFYIILWVSDVRYTKRGIFPLWFATMRTRVSYLVITSLLIAIATL